MHFYNPKINSVYLTGYWRILLKLVTQLNVKSHKCQEVINLISKFQALIFIQRRDTIPPVSKWLGRFQSAITALKTHALVPRFNPLWLLPLGIPEGQSVCATATRQHAWFEEQNYRGCGDHHTWLADQSMAGIGLSPRCVSWDEGCTHRTFVDTYHKLVDLIFHFY